MTRTPHQMPRTPAQGRPVQDILAERKGQHGEFTDNARIAQAIKSVFEEEESWVELSDVQKEALHLISNKLARILSGDPNFHDHWDDISGYAKLVSDRIGKA